MTADRFAKISVAWVGLLLALGLAAVPARAASEEDAKAGAGSAGDPQAGRKVAARCAACHGLNGIGKAPDIPHLAGQHEAVLLAALQAYRTGERAGPEVAVMIDVVSSLSEADAANVAAYYAGLESFASRVKEGGDAAALARKAAQWDPLADARETAAACADCHGPDGNTDIPGFPSLAGQPSQYFVTAIQAYRDGSREHEEMQVFAETLEEQEIEQLATYYAAMQPKRTEETGEGDPYAGRAPAAPCAGCHGENGNPDDASTPRLAGLDAGYLEAATHAYKDGTRDHDVMRSSVTDLGETDIRNLAAFYATKEPRGPREPKPLTTDQWAERCDRCHGAGGLSTNPRIPIIAGQSREYLVNALKLYHGKQRPSTMMFAMTFAMSEAAIENLAAYYAGQVAK